MPRPVAIVTGAARGIGRATAVALAGAGYRVALFGRDTPSLADTLAACEAAAPASAASSGAPNEEPREPPAKARRIEESTAAGSVALAFAADQRDRQQLAAAVRDVVAAFGGVSVLVCNAAVLLATSVLGGDPARWEEELDVNVKGTMALTHAALPHILEGPAPSIGSRAVIVIGSTGSQWSWPYGAGYCASKHALKGFVGSLFEEVRDKGVKVCIIMPGFTDTDMTAANPGMVREKKIQPGDVAHAIRGVLDFPASACPTEILIRPQYKCTDGSVPYTIV